LQSPFAAIAAFWVRPASPDVTRILTVGCAALDEPTTNVDHENMESLAEAIAKYGTPVFV
jgi:hypothetical protein